jgi:hypothetical protein
MLTTLIVIVLVLIFFGFVLMYFPVGQEFLQRAFSGQTFDIQPVITPSQELEIKVKANTPGTGADASLITPKGGPGSADVQPNSASEIAKITPEKVINEPEVFLIQDNIYQYEDAEPLCRAYGARLATMGDLYDAWRKGADWCFYGWVRGQRIVYPTQKESWIKLQESDELETRNKCGLPGLNGGRVRDPTARYGVHCFGVKPPTWRNYKANKMAQTNFTEREQEAHSRATYFKKRLNEYTIMPFNKGEWSTEYQTSYSS